MPCCEDAQLLEDSHTGERVCASCGQVHSGIAHLVADASCATPFTSPDSSATALQRLSELASKLRLSMEAPGEALRLLRALLRDETCWPQPGPVLETLLVCCLLLAARLSGEGGMLTLREVAARARCNDHLVMHRWTRVVARIESHGLLRRADDEAAASPARSDPAQLVERFCETLRSHEVGALLRPAAVAGHARTRALPGAALGPSGATRRLARQLLALARDEWLVDGRSPQLIAAAAVLLATRACGLLGGRAGARGGSAESAAAKLLLASVAIRHLDLGQLRMRISELRGVALSLVRHLPGRARLSEELLLRSLPHALPEVALARATVQELGRQQAAEKEAKAAARLLQVISTIGSAAPPIASGPPAFKEAEQRRRLRAEKLEAARARIAADGDASAPGDAGDADAPPAPPPAPPPARAALNASDLRIEWALRRGVSEAAVLDGWLHSASVSEDAPPRSAQEAPHLYVEELGAQDLPDSELEAILSVSPRQD